MYEINGIVYAGEKQPTAKIIWAEYRGGFILRVYYANGEIVDADFSKIAQGPAFEPLKNEQVLRDFAIIHDTLTWMNEEIDIAPEYLLEVGKMIEPAMQNAI